MFREVDYVFQLQVIPRLISFYHSIHVYIFSCMGLTSYKGNLITSCVRHGGLNGEDDKVSFEIYSVTIFTKNLHLVRQARSILPSPQ